MSVDLVKKNSCGLWVVMPLNLLRQYLLPPSGKFSMEANISVNHAGGGGSRCRREGGGEEEVGAGRNHPCLMIPGVVRRNGVKVFAVRVAGNEVRRGGIDGG